MGKRNQNGLLGITDSKFAFQTSNDIFSFRTLTSGEEFGNDRHLLLLRLEVKVVRLATPIS